MKIRDSHVRDMQISIQLEESERFDVTYEKWYSSTENDTKIRIDGLVASVDLLDGVVSVKGFGYLVNKDGAVGLRDRSLYLKVDDIPFEVRDLIEVEVQQARERIAAVQGVTFE